MGKEKKQTTRRNFMQSTILGTAGIDVASSSIFSIVMAERDQATNRPEVANEVDCIGFGTRRQISCKQIIDCPDMAIYYTDESIQPALYLFDSALLTIER